MNFSDSLLRLTIKNWAAHQKLPEKQLDSLIRRARFSNALLKRKRLPLGAAGLTTARQKREPLPLEQLLSPLSLVGMDKTTLLAPDNNQLSRKYLGISGDVCVDFIEIHADTFVTLLLQERHHHRSYQTSV